MAASNGRSSFLVQDSRRPGEESGLYLQDVPLERRENVSNRASLGYSKEFKMFKFPMTYENLVRNEEKKEELSRALMRKLSKAACAFANARLNGTVYFGVDDDGVVRGIQTDDPILVCSL